VRRVRFGLIAALTSIAGAFGAVETASAATFTVTSNGDTGTGSLRAAITSANANAGSDEIAFDIDGQTIQLASPLPAVTGPVQLSGCENSLTATAPCAEIRGATTSDTILSLASSAPSSVVRGLAFTHGGLGLGSAADFLVAATNRFGIGIDGSAEEDDGLVTGLRTIGDEAIIGNAGDAVRDRNVFGNLTFGLEIGGSGTDIRGNYLGTDPAGSSPLPLGAGITDVAVPGFEPENVTIGGPTGTPGVCAGFCNVIAHADALDESPGIQFDQTDGLTVAGNFIGLAADGSAMPNRRGIRVAGSDNVTIGGATPAQRNYIVASDSAVSNSSGAVGPGENTVVRNNFVGLNPAGTASVTPPDPTLGGISVVSRETGPALVSENRVALPGISISASGDDATVADNVVGIGTGGESLPGGKIGIQIASARNTVVIDNAVGNTTTAAVGVSVGGDNELTQNLLGRDTSANPHPNLGTGISIVGSSGNRIGPLNQIHNSGANAIAVTESFSPASENLIFGNSGSDNVGLWTDLGADGLGNASDGPNGGVQAPVITAATATEASGIAAPGAFIEIYGKQTPALGEISGVIAETETDQNGNWTTTYSDAQPAAQPIAAAAMVPGSGTSELAFFGLPSLPPSASAPVGATLAPSHANQCDRLRGKLKKLNPKAKRAKRKLRRKLRKLGC
jgi:hypothetical protein